MPVTEVTQRSWFSRLGGAFKGVLFGLILVAASVVLLWWNEGRAVRRAKALSEGAGVVVSVPWDRVDPGNEGKLVHVVGLATTDEVLEDPEFGVQANAIHLRRKVEMYQWVERTESETRKKLGGGTETTTTYSYSKNWSDREIDSSSFHEPTGHANPRMPYRDQSFTAREVTLGAFRLSPGLIDRISGGEALRPSSLAALPAELRGRTQLSAGGFYLGGDPSSPRVGDLRVTFETVEPDMISVVAVQSGDTFTPYRAKTGSVELLSRGSVSADQMFASAQQANRTLTWLLRLGGFLLMLIGFRTVLRPFSVLADVLPMLGNLAETASGIFAFFLAAFVSLLVIALAWLFYRPLLGLGLLVLAVLAGYGVIRLAGRARRRAKVAAPPPPPPAPATP